MTKKAYKILERMDFFWQFFQQHFRNTHIGFLFSLHFVEEDTTCDFGPIQIKQ